jgi:hypothetical protein
MRDLKKWVMVLMASFMLVGVATGCNDSETNTDENTEQNEDTDTTESENSEDQETEE